ncbi:MAG TPA: hypothetical protein VFW22_18740 [Pseudolabrys sp.]|nr:hypothetical protein [Pseudolabrys sp.]
MKRIYSRQALLLGLAALALAASSSGALALISAEQQSAIRGNCRSDFLSNCSGVPRGGKEALDCLRQHMAQLSPACGGAVKAVTPPAAAAPPPSPAAKTAPPPPPSPAAVAPPPPAATAPPPPAVAPAPKQTAVPPKTAAPKPKAKKVEEAHPAPRAAVSPQPIYSTAKIEKLRPVQRLRIVRACNTDRDASCHGVEAGGSRIILCLAEHAAALSPACRKAMEPLLKARGR